jgi:hypothetical protein
MIRVDRRPVRVVDPRPVKLIYPRILAAVVIVLAVFAVVPASAAAQRLDLSVSPAVISFVSADPDTVPVLSSAPVTVNYRVRQNNRETWLLTVIAAGDLVSGPSVVDISAVSWLAAPVPPFQGGTLSKTVARTVAAGVGNVASPSTGSLTFRLANSWTYDAGIYTQTIVFTLSTP